MQGSFFGRGRLTFLRQKFLQLYTSKYPSRTKEHGVLTNSNKFYKTLSSRCEERKEMAAEEVRESQSWKQLSCHAMSHGTILGIQVRCGVLMQEDHHGTCVQAILNIGDAVPMTSISKPETVIWGLLGYTGTNTRHFCKDGKQGLI